MAAARHEGDDDVASVVGEAVSDRIRFQLISARDATGVERTYQLDLRSTYGWGTYGWVVAARVYLPVRHMISATAVYY
jgi:hypothetical protein